MLRPFQSETHAKRTYRELELLMHLNHQDAQVVQLYNVFTPEKNVNDFQTLYVLIIWK
jgi:p38 MAP kinase